MATRVLPGNSNPYLGGNVVFDSTPYTNFFLQKQAQEKAKEEALDNYFRDLDKNINPAGVRSQDISDLLKQQNSDRQFYLQNRNKIKNPSLDNGRAYNEYMARNQAKLAYVNQSKQEAEKYKQMAPLFADPQKRALMDESTLANIELHDLPLNDPKRKSFNITDIQFNPKPFDTLSFSQKVGSGLKTIDETPIIKTDPNTFTKTITTNQTLSPDSIYSLAQRGAAEYVSNPSYKKFINDLHKDEDQFNKLNSLYSKYIGKDIQNDADLAAAYALSSIPITSSKTTTTNDQLALNKYNQDQLQKRQKESFAHQEQMEKMRNNNRINLLQLRQDYKNADNKKQSAVIDNMIDRFKKSGTSIEYTDGQTGKKTTVTEINLTPETLSLFAKKDDKGHKVNPDAVFILPNGDFRYITYKRDKDNNIISKNGNKAIDNTVSGIAAKDDVKANMGKKLFGVKNTYGEMGLIEDDIPEEIIFSPNQSNNKFIFPQGKTKF